MDEDLIFKELAYGSSAASKKDVALQALFQSKTDDEQKFPQFIPLQQKKQSNWIDDDIFSPKADSKVEEPAPQKLLPFLQRLPALSSSEIRSLRKDQKIHVDGSSIPTPIRIVFPASLSEIIAANRFETPTPIQMQGIPVLMAKRNLIAVAPTGSGKTAAYLLPIISSIIEMRTQKKTEKELNIHPLRAVIIAPTRELERQILETAAELSRGLNIKVSQPKTKTQSVERTHSSSTTPSSSTSNVLFTIPKGANIAVCSPHSAFQLVRQDNNVFSALDYAIFDEADKLWDDSFKDKAAVILSAVQRSSFVSCGFFSATMSESIMSILKSQLDMPIEMTVGVPSTAAENVIQELKYCGNEEGKFIALRDLLEGGGTPLLPPIAVFVQSKERCEELCAALKEEQRKAVMLHSSLTKRESDYALESIRNGSAWIIVATELMARGMDLRSLNAVINYDFPQSVESYVHRIGRSGRRRTGYAVTFFTEEDFPSLPMIANVIKQSGGHVEEYMLHLKELTFASNLCFLYVNCFSFLDHFKQFVNFLLSARMSNANLLLHLQFVMV
eukprot:MONOS_4159.1-p1 / transcript=MONOS_4159.1 / gene=MONOS_4159 / organism=Monocercomonoides_exilis_PA203 / gene_product=Ddx52 protein , putative RNA helicase / transcript_product=putative RNA helicase / location=Mono_scaffold00106:110263-112712(+) / protein_length=557 / sequence_SO=supercontig / SO=protein_coding / is_pseudo=false